MQEQHENLFAYLQNVRKTAIEERDRHERALLEDAWQKFKDYIEESAKNCKTQETIRVREYGSWEHIILKHCDEIINRLKVLGFTDQHIEINKQHTYLTLSWGD